MNLIDGKTLAKTIRTELKEEVAAMSTKPQLNVLLVGHDPASELYVSLKEKAALEAGIGFHAERVEADMTDDELVELIKQWNRDPDVHAILVQLPLPSGHDDDKIVAAINPDKDVDGFHPDNLQALKQGELRIAPPVVEGCLRLMNETSLALNGARIALVVNSDIFAVPFERLLKAAGAKIVSMNPDAIDRAILATADAVIVAVGRPGFIKRGMTKTDAVLIDVGTNRLDNGGITGDVDMASYEDTDAWVTPVPGGVGPMTIAMLLKNVVRLAESAASEELAA